MRTLISTPISSDPWVQSGQSRGFGFVEMASDAEAQAAIDGLNGTELGERALTVSQARPREERPGGQNQRRFDNGGRSGRNRR